MSVADQVARIRGEKSRLAIKLSAMNLANQTDSLELLVDAVEDIEYHGHPDIKVKEGNSTTLDPGYYNGISITGINNEALDAEEFALQANKTVTPDKKGHQVVCDEGYYGLSSVTVNPIPVAYQDVTQVNATAEDVLSPKKFVKADGTVVVGEIPTLNGASTFTPIKANVPSVLVEGGTYVKGDIAVAPIPDKYQDVSGVTATAADVLTNKKIVLPDGTAVDGQIPIIGEQQIILGYEDNGEWTEYHQIEKGYHDGESTIFIVKEAKEATPNKTTQVILPSASRVLEKVTVNPIPNTFLDTTDTANHKGNNNLTASDATVTVEAGYYPSGASKSVKNVGKVEIAADPLVVDDQSGVMRNLQINAFVTEIDVLLDPSLEEELATI